MGQEINMRPDLLIETSNALSNLGERIGQLTAKQRPATVPMTAADWGNFGDVGQQYLSQRESNDMDLSSLKQEARADIADPFGAAAKM